MDLTTWFAFASASIALLLIPGPTVLLVLAYALGRGDAWLFRRLWVWPPGILLQ